MTQQQQQQDQGAGPAAGDTAALPQGSRGGAGGAAGGLKQGEGPAGHQAGLAHLLQGLDTAAATDQKSNYVSAEGTAAGVAEPAAMVLDV
jgi:uncharacterized protein YidB (DUF937 family)